MEAPRTSLTLFLLYCGVWLSWDTRVFFAISCRDTLLAVTTDTIDTQPFCRSSVLQLQHKKEKSGSGLETTLSCVYNNIWPQPKAPDALKNMTRGRASLLSQFSDSRFRILVVMPVFYGVPSPRTWNTASVWEAVWIGCSGRHSSPLLLLPYTRSSESTWHSDIYGFCDAYGVHAIMYSASMETSCEYICLEIDRLCNISLIVSSTVLPSWFVCPYDSCEPRGHPCDLHLSPTCITHMYEPPPGISKPISPCFTHEPPLLRYLESFHISPCLTYEYHVSPMNTMSHLWIPILHLWIQSVKCESHLYENPYLVLKTRWPLSLPDPQAQCAHNRTWWRVEQLVEVWPPFHPSGCTLMDEKQPWCKYRSKLVDEKQPWCKYRSTSSGGTNANRVCAHGYVVPHFIKQFSYHFASMTDHAASMTDHTASTINHAAWRLKNSRKERSGALLFAGRHLR